MEQLNGLVEKCARVNEFDAELDLSSLRAKIFALNMLAKRFLTCVRNRKTSNLENYPLF